MNTVFKEFREIVRYRELLRNLVSRDLKVRYKRSVLGFIWVMLNPLLMMLILSMVFSELFKVSTRNYTAYLLSGIILWNFFSQSTSTSIASLLANSNLIKKVYIPKAIFPLSVVISATVNFLFSLVPLALVLIVSGAPIGSNVLLLPLVVMLVAIFSFGIALILSTLTVFFHDMIYIYDVLLLAWMYLTPVFYPESIVPGKFLIALKINPMYYFVSAFRGALYMDVSFLPSAMLYGVIFSLASLALGWFVYTVNREKVVYRL